MSTRALSTLNFTVKTAPNGTRSLVVRDDTGRLLTSTEVSTLLGVSGGGGGGSTVTIDADGTLVVNGTTVELGTDSEIVASILAALSTYAPLNSPVFSGNPTAPTQALGNSSQRLATTQFVNTAIANMSTQGYLDGGDPTSVYGGIAPIDGGTP